MKLLIATILLLASCVATKEIDYSATDVLLSTRSSVFSVSYGGYGGAAYAIESGILVTSAHLLTKNPNPGNPIVEDYRGKPYLADVLGVDTDEDIAVLRIPIDTTFLDSSVVLPGELVYLIGNPFHIASHAITRGIVSHVAYYIFTDASINPGNSGGPCLNSLGQVVGMAKAWYGSETGNGIAVIIPQRRVIDTARRLIAEANP